MTLDQACRGAPSAAAAAARLGVTTQTLYRRLRRDPEIACRIARREAQAYVRRLRAASRVELTVSQLGRFVRGCSYPWLLAYVYGDGPAVAHRVALGLPVAVRMRRL